MMKDRRNYAKIRSLIEAAAAELAEDTGAELMTKQAMDLGAMVSFARDAYECFKGLDEALYEIGELYEN
ncbi:hypothetical protein [Faecalibaculum rodentium]|uniref:hypothetical protein n=1 Tax=Faecalibaculum rodentium TaxID=1702221 RepID=UPI0025B73A3F|nr:hypothetical protein [Faecalibaculum rodentium]